jgi:cobalt-zinc-cadmium efflux system protein
MTEKLELVRGSGNVFRDFGDPNADLEQARAILASKIISVLDERKLSVRAAESLTVEGAYLEVVADLIGSLAVIASMAIIALTGWEWVDAFAGAVLGVWILPRAWHLGRQALRVLLQAAPPGLDLAAVRSDLAGVDGVVDVHDLHVWTLTSGVHALSVHAILQEGATHGQVLGDLRTRVTDGFPITHVTVQIEERCCGEHAHA